MTMMTTKYYRGSAANPGAEISAADAEALRTYTKAHYAPDGALARTELHDSGRLLEVNYHSSRDPAAIVSSHLREYPGVRFRVWRTVDRLPGFVWKFVHGYDASGAPTGFSRILSDEDGRELMQVDLDESRRVTQITKYAWGEGGDLRYAFEYDEHGAPTQGLDLMYGDQASVEEVAGELPEPAFFQNGYTLPDAIAPRGVPADPH